MPDRDLLEPVDPAGPRKRQPGARALGSVSSALARLVSRPRGDDGSFDAGTGMPMSDEELREAFRLASLTVTPAPLGRPSRREVSSPPGDESGGSGYDVSSPLRTPSVAPPPAEAAGAPARPARPPVMSAMPASGSAAAPQASPLSVPEPESASASALASAAASESAAASPSLATRTPPPPATGQRPGLETAADPLRPIGTLPDPIPADQVQLPGNLAFSVDDFFGGLVRRIERRP